MNATLAAPAAPSPVPVPSPAAVPAPPVPPAALLPAASAPAAAAREPVVRVRRLSVAFRRNGARHEAVRDVSFDLLPGEILALVGESGSGKSVTARTLLGLAGEGAEIVAERLEIEGEAVAADPPARWRRRRGRQVGLVLQDALVSLDPLRTIGSQVRSVLDAHRTGPRAGRAARAVAALEDCGVPDAGHRARQYSGQLSGGLRQRALIASAIAGNPRILIADEPTTALDPATQRQILTLLSARARRGDAVLLITHDIAVVGEIADRVLVMKDGRIVEHGPCRAVLAAPAHPYTRALLAALPEGKPKGVRLLADARLLDGVHHLDGGRPPGGAAPRPRLAAAVARQGDTPGGAVVPAETGDAIVATALAKRYAGRDGRTLAAVEDVSFRVGHGRTLGLVGGSGAGKTTIARMLMGFLAPDSGSVEMLGAPWSAVPEAARRQRRRLVQMVYQDPLGSFDPRLDVAGILRDALEAGGLRDRAEIGRRSRALLDVVGLGAAHLEARPLRLSGGQRQRIAIARALAPRPKVLLCDEPVAALDASTQAQVLDLLADIQQDFGLTCVFISHDLGVIQHVSDTIVVLKDGRVVEQGPARTVYGAPSHPYTQALFAAVPRLAPPQQPAV